MQMRQASIADEIAADIQRDEIVAVEEAIRLADRLIDARENAVPDVLEGTDRSLGAIDRAMIARGYR